MKRSIQYNDQIIEFEIFYRKRKSISIKVNQNGNIEVAAPININENYVVSFVSEKAKWILEKKNEMQELKNNKKVRNFQEGSTLMFLGDEIPVDVRIDEKYKCSSIQLCNEDNHKYFKINTCDDDIEKLRKIMEMWYREKTYEIVCERVKKYSTNFTDKVNGIRIRDQKRRWASINIKNEINFNWRICMAPIEVVDYIVVHEMCHMDFRDHSKRFWARVGSIMPFYKIYHNYLKENGMNMYI